MTDSVHSAAAAVALVSTRAHGAGPLRALLLAVLLAGPGIPAARAADEPVPAGAPALPTTLGPGDIIGLAVFGQPDMSGNLVVGEDGSIDVPLAGNVAVAGLGSAAAARAIEQALRDRELLRQPAAIVTMVQPRSQRVAVLGEVGAPGRYVLEPDATVLAVLAEAGGVRETGANRIFVLRTGADGSTRRFAVDLDALTGTSGSLPELRLAPGDSIVVPRADQFYVYGQVNAPNTYRLEPGMTVLQAIARAGGLTARGSDRSVRIRRKRPDGSYADLKGKPADRIEADDVIRVRERWF